MHYNYKCDKSFYNKNTNVHKIIQTLKQNHPRTHKHTYKHTHTHTHTHAHAYADIIIRLRKSAFTRSIT